jgi:hypothetical protein
MDLNQLYFDHQISLMKADGASTSLARRGHERDADRLAGSIGQLQVKLGAAAACAWMMRFSERTA